VPAPLLICSGLPVWAGKTQRDVALFLTDLKGAWADCHDKLDEVRKFVAPEPPT